MKNKLLLITLSILISLSFLSAAPIDIKNSYLNNGLTHFYGLQENSGTVVIDNVTSLNLTNNGATIAQSGVSGTSGVSASYSFDGASSYLSSLTATQLNSSGFSVSMWMYINSGTAYILMGSLDSGSNGLTIQYGNANGCTLGNFCIQSQGTTPLQFTASPNGAWHNLIVSYNSNGTATLFYDGAYQTSGAFTINFPTVQGYYIGASNTVGTASNFVNGKMELVGIWNYPLNGTAASDLYNSGSGLPYEVPTPPSTPGYVTTISPSNGTVYKSGQTAIFNANITPTTGINLNNATLYIYYSNSTLFYNKTNLLSGNQTKNTSFSVTMPSDITPSILQWYVVGNWGDGTSGNRSSSNLDDGLIFVIPNNNYCYQQSATVSNQSNQDNCNGMFYTGNYSFVNTSSEWINQGLAKDGNWSTNSTITYGGPGQLAYLYSNYTIPSLTMDAYFSFKIKMNNGFGIGIVKIPREFITGTNTLQMLQLVRPAEIYVIAPNGTTNLLTTFGNPSESSNDYFFENSVIWSLSPIINQTSIIPDIYMLYNQNYDFNIGSYFSQASYYKIGLLNPDTNQSINISFTNPVFLSSIFSIRETNISNVTNFRFSSLDKNYSSVIIPYACVDSTIQCVQGNNFTLNINQSITPSGGLITGGSNWLDGILPDNAKMSLGQSLTFVILAIFIIDIIIILAVLFMNYEMGALFFAFIGLIDFFIIILATALGYIPIWLFISLVVFGLIIGGVLFRKR